MATTAPLPSSPTFSHANVPCHLLSESWSWRPVSKPNRFRKIVLHNSRRGEATRATRGVANIYCKLFSTRMTAKCHLRVDRDTNERTNQQMYRVCLCSAQGAASRNQYN